MEKREKIRGLTTTCEGFVINPRIHHQDFEQLNQDKNLHYI